MAVVRKTFDDSPRALRVAIPWPRRLAFPGWNCGISLYFVAVAEELNFTVPPAD